MHNVNVSAIINENGTLDLKLIQHAKDMQKKGSRSYKVDLKFLDLSICSI